MKSMSKNHLLENVKFKIIKKWSDNSLKHINEIQYWSTNMALQIYFLLVCISLSFILSLTHSLSISLFTYLYPHTFILLSWEHFLFDVNYYIHINPDPTAWPSVILSIFTWQRNMHIREYNTSKVKREM